MKVYIVMEEDIHIDYIDTKYYIVDCVYDTRENAQAYIDSSRNPQKYIIIEKDVFTHTVDISYK